MELNIFWIGSYNSSIRISMTAVIAINRASRRVYVNRAPGDFGYYSVHRDDEGEEGEKPVDCTSPLLRGSARLCELHQHLFKRAGHAVDYSSMRLHHRLVPVLVGGMEDPR